MRPLVIFLTSIVTCATVGTTLPTPRPPLFPGEDRDLAEENEKQKAPKPQKTSTINTRLLAEGSIGVGLLGAGVAVGAIRGHKDGFDDGLEQGRKEINLREREYGRTEGYRDAMGKGFGNFDVSACVTIKVSKLFSYSVFGFSSAPPETESGQRSYP